MANVATPSRPPTAKTAKRGDVEYIKENSDYLRHPLMQVGAVRLRAVAPAGSWQCWQSIHDGSCRLQPMVFLPLAVAFNFRHK